MATFPYSESYQPPAPVAEITLISSAEGLRAGPFHALLDSGADGTLVPLRHLDAILAPVTVEMTIRSYWGEPRRVLLYLVDVQIADIVLPGIEIVGDDEGDELVLGRNVLNKLRLVLDGPGRTSSLSS